jgi:hypothetical protein
LRDGRSRKLEWVRIMVVRIMTVQILTVRIMAVRVLTVRIMTGHWVTPYILLAVTRFVSPDCAARSRIFSRFFTFVFRAPNVIRADW